MNIVIVDDDALVALSLKTILETGKNIEVLAIGSSGEDGVRLYEQLSPDVLLMDIRMGGMTGLEAAEKILKKDKTAKILFLTTFSDDDYIIKALEIGARGYILKQDFDGIESALLAVTRGQSVFGSRITSRLPELIQNKNGFDYSAHGIGERELDIIRAVAKGLSNKEIASELFLSEGTVRNYLSEILNKLELRDRTQLAVFFYTNV